MISQGEATIDELGSTLRSLGPVNVRLMVRRTEEGPLLVTSIVDAGQGSDEFEEATYDYGDVAFAKAVLDGSDVADWLTGGSGKVDGLEFSLPEPQRDCFVRRSASRAYGSYGTFRTLPHTEYEVPFHTKTESRRSGALLAGVGRPFFPGERVAAASVLLDDHSASFNRSIPYDSMLVWIAHPEAYIGKVRVSSAAITVPVLGEELEDVYLQVFSAGNSHEEPVSEPGEIPVSISGADRADAWVSLVRGREWLDFRRISSHWPESLDQKGIVYDLDDLSERLDRLRRVGESERVDFKEAPPDGDKIAKVVAAFANSSGGTIIIGVRDGTGEVVGVNDAPSIRDSLDNIVRNNVSPPPKYDFLTGKLKKRTVIAMRVESGDDRPYGVRGKGGIRYYIRHNATNWVAEPEEMREICQPRQSDDRPETDDYRLLR